MSSLVAYVLVLVVFGASDAVWLTTMGPVLYRPTLGDILLTRLRIGPAIAFYLMYPVGLVIFAAAPAIKSGSVTSSLIYGALFGAFAYATNDLTNYATLKNWTLQITLGDIVYGAVVSGIAAGSAVLLVRALLGWIGGASG